MFAAPLRFFTASPMPNKRDTNALSKAIDATQAFSGEPAGHFQATGEVHVRQAGNWLIKMVRLADTGDQQCGTHCAAQGISSRAPLPDSLWLPSYWHDRRPGHQHEGTFCWDSMPCAFRWKDLWRSVERWVRPAALRDFPQSRAASVRHPPDSCWCTHNGVPDPLVDGANKYLIVFIWNDPGGLMVGVHCGAHGHKPDIQTNFQAEVPYTCQTGMVARTAAMFTDGPSARWSAGNPHRPQAPLPSGPVPQQRGTRGGPTTLEEAARLQEERRIQVDALNARIQDQCVNRSWPRASGQTTTSQTSTAPLWPHIHDTVGAHVTDASKAERRWSQQPTNTPTIHMQPVSATSESVPELTASRYGREERAWEPAPADQGIDIAK